MEIVLMRHGPPDFDDSRWLHQHDLATLIAEYSSSRVTVSATASARAVVASFRADIVVCSSMARSIDSARALGYDDVIVLPELDEADLPSPAWLRLPVPYSTAILLARLGWFVGYSPNAASLQDAVARARDAATALLLLAQGRGAVLAVGHGIVNELVGRELVRSGWVREKKVGSGYWSATRYREPDV